MAALLDKRATDHQLIVDNDTVWMQANRIFGNMALGLSDNALENRDRALRIVREHTIASQIIRMKPFGRSGFVDLGPGTSSADLIKTDGLITLSPDHVLHANPADCGQISVSGFSTKMEQSLIGSFHASRRIVEEGGHIDPIEYICETYGIEPSELKVKLSPSARKTSYVFEDIDATQKVDDGWQKYIGQTDSGMWYVDFHQRTIDELEAFGICSDNMYVNPDDTADPNSDYFSHRQHAMGKQEIGGNGLLFAMR